MSKVWMPLYIGDYLADTAHLDAAEHGAYLLLMMHYWRNGPLPKVHKQLQQIAHLNGRGSLQILRTVLTFFEEREDAYYHKRIDQERQKAADHKEAQRKRTEAARAKLQEKRKSVTETVTKSPSPSPSPLPSEDIGRAKSATTKRKTKIPQGFPGPAEIAWAIEHEHVPKETAEREAVKFRRDAEAKAKTFAMWDRAWQNWITGGLEKGWIGQGPKQSQSDKDDAAFREAARRIEASQ